MKLAMGELSFPKEWPLEKVFENTKAYGFDGFEFWLEENEDSGFIHLNSTKEDAKRIRELADQYGLELSSLACGLGWKYPMSASDAEMRAKAKNVVKKQIELAHYLGCDSILVVPGYVQVTFIPDTEIVDYEYAYNRMLEGIHELKEYAEECRVSIGIENVTNKVLMSPLEMRDFIDHFQSEYVGAYFDVANALFYGYPEHWARILGKRIKTIHIKDYFVDSGPVDILTGEVDYPAVAKVLKEIPYNGWLVSEVFFQDDFDIEMKKTIEAMRKIRDMVTM